jgi:hypothetical protein
MELRMAKNKIIKKDADVPEALKTESICLAAEQYKKQEKTRHDRYFSKFHI